MATAASTVASNRRARVSGRRAIAIAPSRISRIDDAVASQLGTLTPREREVLGEMAQGKSNPAISASLSLSIRAVEKHINAIFSKLMLAEESDIDRRVKAVLIFLSRS